MIVIDGSQGEGGGQILRTALALSMVTGKPFQMEKVRAGREKPGLMRQHLTALRAAAEVCGATVSGDELGSRTLSFSPGLVRPGHYEFKVGTAGSATLVLQTILPPLLAAGGPSDLVLEGGTHNPFAPPFNFLDKCFLPLINRMGATIHANLERPGFYPAGGGRFTISIQPAAKLKALDLLEAGALRRHRAVALVGGLSRNIAEREVKVIARRLGWEADCLQVEIAPNACGPGNLVTVELEYAAHTEVFTGFGQTRVSAEAVAEQVVEEVRRYLAAQVPVGEHLADQLMVPLALAGGGAYRTLPLSRHAVTNRAIIGLFLDVPIAVEEVENRNVIVRVGPAERIPRY
jgi:RNA 3'-terminal phosphate cyclase (ATP)